MQAPGGQPWDQDGSAPDLGCGGTFEGGLFAETDVVWNVFEATWQPWESTPKSLGSQSRVRFACFDDDSDEDSADVTALGAYCWGDPCGPVPEEVLHGTSLQIDFADGVVADLEFIPADKEI